MMTHGRGPAELALERPVQLPAGQGRGGRRLTRVAAIVALVVVAVGVGLTAAGKELGTATAPFVMAFDPRASLWALLAALALSAVVALAAALQRWPRTPAAFAAVSFALALVLALTVNAARMGPAGWTHVFDLGPGGSFEAKNEYLPGLPALDHGVWFFLDRFAENVPAMPVNVGAHPPGLMLIIHALGLKSAFGLATLCILAAAACVPLTYWLARALVESETTARTAALLAAVSPCLLLFGTTSADAVYAASGLLAARGLVARRRTLRALGCVVLALATLGSWALLAFGVWAAVVVWRREDWKAALALAVGCGVAVGLLSAALAVAYGYDAIGTLVSTEGLYRNSLASIRPYAFWVLGSPVAWGLMLGLPIAAGALAAVADGRPAAQALAVVIVVAAVAGFTKAETERIWLPFVPLACIAAAEMVPSGRLRMALGLLAVQALVIQLAFDTVW